MFKNGIYNNFVFIYSSIDVLAPLHLKEKFHNPDISYNHILLNQQKLSFWKCVSKAGLVLIEPITPCFESTSMHSPIKPNKGKTNMIFVLDFFILLSVSGTVESWHRLPPSNKERLDLIVGIDPIFWHFFPLWVPYGVMVSINAVQKGLHFWYRILNIW